MTDRKDPWAAITPPAGSTTVSARRASAGRWDLFWAVDVHRDCLLFLGVSEKETIPRRFPNLRGVKIQRRGGAEETRGITLRLLDEQQRDLFHRLCRDIVGVTEKAETESAAVAAFLGRTERWRRLLARGHDDRLSQEKQKGLLAELTVLSEHLFPAIGVSASVRAWSGPTGSPKDFEIEAVCVEAKARRGAAAPHVVISSEYQLDSDGITALFLYVLDVAVGLDDGIPGTTITEAVAAVSRQVEGADFETRALFEERLTATGFDPDHDYSDMRWKPGDERLFEVAPDFPRIVPSMFPEGASRVRYRIGLPACERFRVDPSALRSRLIGGPDVDDD